MIRRKIISVLLAVTTVLLSAPLIAYAVPTNTSAANATLLGTSTIGTPITINGISTGQSQWFKISATAGQYLYFAIYGLSSTADYDLFLRNSSLVSIGTSVKGEAVQDYVRYDVPTTGTYYIEINAFIATTSNSCVFKAILAGGTAGTSATNSSYNRTAAYTYMNTWYNSYNPNYPNFTGLELGGDCANFVSQCIFAGGLNMSGYATTRDADTSWFCNSSVMNTNYYSGTWSAANSFTAHWGTRSIGTGYKRAYQCRYYLGKDIADNFSTFASSIQVGDVIQLTNAADTARSHTLIVSSKTNTNVLMASHTSAQLNRSLLTDVQGNPNMMFAVIRIKSGV